MAPRYAGVCLLDAPYCIDREYDYRIPDELPEGVQPGVGSFVSVPFGNGNQRRLALITRLSDTSATDEAKIKPVYAFCPDRVALNDEMMGVCRFLRAHTLCTTGDAVHAMIPSAALSKLTEFYTVTGKPLPDSAAFDARTLLIYTYIAEHGRVSGDLIKSKFGSKAAESTAVLLAVKLIGRELEIKNSRPEKTVSSFALVPDADTVKQVLEGKCPGCRRPASEMQRAVLQTLLDRGAPMSGDELREITGAGRVQLNALIKKELLREDKSTVNRDLALLGEAASGDGVRADITLNEEQTAAYRTLAGLYDSAEAHGALLYGVTGSGKTCVMLALIDRVLASGRRAIVLLPEIALTPQSLAIFCTRYGRRVAVVHSGLSAGERYDAYLRISQGGADLVIGTRSAVFAPVRNLGLIIIDEEQEHTYKSDMSPRYHARDIARYRCASNKALMLLASATPSLESRKKADDGVYTLVRLTGRYGGVSLPAVTVADMRAEPRSGNLTPIGALLSQKLQETFERGEQSILFLNRRGYNNYISCAVCGEAVVCPGCSVSMTYHTRRGTYDDGELICHWCGRHIAVPTVCPSCGSEHLIRMGYGTQRVEQELQILLPEARILRMDTDTTSGRQAYDELLGKFRRHEGDILLGTQMVTKGHDFPDVTLVGVLLADASLYYDDFRAAERTFAMLTQVIGRAGRRETPGEAVIQTNNPEHEVILLAKSQDYETFYRREINLRRVLAFPPYCDIVLLTLTSSSEKDLALAAKRLSDMLRLLLKSERYVSAPMILFGPFEAPVYRVDSKYRMRMVVKCKLNGTSRSLFATIISDFSRSGARAPLLSVDFNPTNL